MLISVLGAAYFAIMELYASFSNYRILQQQMARPSSEGLSIKHIRFTQPVHGTFIHILFALVCFIALEAFALGILFLMISFLYFFYSMKGIDQALVLQEAFRQAGAEQFMATVRLSLVLTSLPYAYFLLRILLHLAS